MKTDESLRVLERAHAADPTEENLHRLQDERRRRGRGWFGEIMPTNVYAAAEREIYFYALPRQKGGPGVGAHFCADLQLVYVPGGEVECERCNGNGYTHTGYYDTPDGTVALGDINCLACNGTGKRKITPYYLSRFPITNVQYRAFLLSGAASRENDERQNGHSRSGNDHHPVVNVSLDDARAFCEWAGLRLPSEAEWKWAAIGDPVKCSRCFGRGWRREAAGSDKDISVRCFACKETGKESRRYPWGQEPPSPERCVFNQMGGGDESWLYGGDPSTAPVVVEAHVCTDGKTYPVQGERPRVAQCPEHGMTGESRLVPARPLGASWAGCHDMAGNVWEWTETLLADGLMARTYGGSFRQQDLSEALHHGASHRVDTGHDAVGFRVALSVAPPPSR